MRYMQVCAITLFTFLSFASRTPGQEAPSAIQVQRDGSLGREIIAGPVGGAGTTNYLAIWTSSATLGSSLIYQAGNRVGIGTTTPYSSLDVVGSLNVSGAYRIGQNAVLSAAGTNNLFLGVGAGINNTSGSGNIFSGSGAGQSNTTAGYNTFSGFQAGYFNTSGGGNTFTGVFAGFDNTAGGQNSFFGGTAGLSNTTGSDNTFIGYNAGYVNAIGMGNTFTGYAVGFNSVGNENTFSGSYAGYYNTSGSYNIFSGFYAGAGNTTGNHNTYIGNEAGFSNNGVNNIYLGDSAGAGMTNESNTIRLGSPTTVSAAYIAGIYGTNVSGVTVQVNSNGQLGVLPSSRRYKEQILNLADESSKLMLLRPVSFLYKSEYVERPQKLQYGLIAEEVGEVYPELVEYGKDGQPYTVRYQELIPILLREAQSQHQRAEAQAVVITKQEQKIEELEQRLSRLEGLVEGGVKVAEDNNSVAVQRSEHSHSTVPQSATLEVMFVPGGTSGR